MFVKRKKKKEHEEMKGNISRKHTPRTMFVKRKKKKEHEEIKEKITESTLTLNHVCEEKEKERA